MQKEPREISRGFSLRACYGESSSSRYYKIENRQKSMKLGFNGLLCCLQTFILNRDLLRLIIHRGFPYSTRIFIDLESYDKGAFSKPNLTTSPTTIKLAKTRIENFVTLILYPRNVEINSSSELGSKVQTGHFPDKPIFEPFDPKEMIGMEREPFVISVEANANPSKIVYTWMRDGLSLSSGNKRIIANDSTLNITQLERHDAGTYTCEARNNEGSTYYKLNLTVQCKWTFIHLLMSVVICDPRAITFFLITRMKVAALSPGRIFHPQSF